MEDVRGVSRLVAILFVLGGSTACATLHARAQPDGPPLETPAAPPKTIVPADAGTTAAPTPAAAVPPPASAPAPPAATAPAVAAPPTRRATQEAPPPASAPAKPDGGTPADAAASRTLQTTRSGEVEQRVRALLANAARDLGRIDYRKLGADARSQYDFAKRFSQQADDAMRAKNFVFAEQLASKAASLAALLQNP